MYYNELYKKLPDDLCACVILFAGDAYRAHQRDYLRMVYVNVYKNHFGKRFIFKNVLRDPLTLDYYISLSVGLRTPPKMKSFRIARHRKPYLRLKLTKQLDHMLRDADCPTWWNCFVRSHTTLNTVTVYMA